jgi:predicted O-methyltransferase YrrM
MMRRPSSNVRGRVPFPTHRFSRAVSVAFLCGLTLLQSSPLCQSQGQPAKTAPSSKPYRFTADWFSPDIPKWEKYLAQFRGKPNLRYLEIGVFEGRSVVWMLENILTHPTARFTCIDPFFGDLMARFVENLKISGSLDKATIIKGFSQDKLKDLAPDSFHIIYIDGSHAAADVLVDAVLSWPLLKNGGILIFDDYGWHPEIPLEVRPQAAVEAFLTAYRNRLEVLDLSYQAIFKKKDIPPGDMLVIGNYRYDWWKKELFSLKTGAHTPLSVKERVLFERLLSSRKFGEIQFSPPPELVADKRFAALLNRLKISLR